MDDARVDACIQQLSADETETTVLAVSLNQSPDAWLRRFREATDVLPNRIGLVVSGAPARSTSAATGGDGWRLPPAESVSVTTVDDPGDLTALGIKVNEFVEQWASEGNADDDRQLLFCFESLTVLLQYAEIERAFRFLHVLVDRLRRRGVEAHFHLDPTTQDEQTLATLAPLFDDVVETPAESRVEVRER